MSGGGYQNSGLLRFGQNPYQGYNPGAAFPQYTTPAIFQSPYVSPILQRAGVSSAPPISNPVFGGGDGGPGAAVGPSNDQGPTPGLSGPAVGAALGLLGLPPALGMAVSGIGATPGVGNDADAAAAAAANGSGMGPAGIGPGDVGDTGNTNGPADSAGDGGGGTSK